MPLNREPGEQKRPFRAWLLAAVGAIVVGLATAWTQHWFGPPRSPSMSSTAAPVTPSIVPEDLVGKWMYSDEHFWVIRPGASDKYEIEYYTPSAELVGEGEGQVTDGTFDFTLRAHNHFVRGVMILETQQLSGRLRLIGRELSGPTSALGMEVLETGDPSRVVMLTLSRP